uniref:Uncharacterized protein n=1 Tax=Dunaliella tertiolecta TaxID=3047 RepID=A0A6S8P5L5_DUNTE
MALCLSLTSRAKPAAAVAAAATTRARHGRRSGTNGRFGQAHAQQQLQASGPVRPSTTFESENESDSDQDVAASRAALRADAQRERLKQMLSGKMGRELFGQKGAQILPAKIAPGGGNAGPNQRLLQWQASKQKERQRQANLEHAAAAAHSQWLQAASLARSAYVQGTELKGQGFAGVVTAARQAQPALPSVRPRPTLPPFRDWPVLPSFRKQPGPPRPLAHIAAGITSLMEHTIMLMDQLRAQHLQVQASIESAQSILDELRADKVAKGRASAQRGWRQGGLGMLGMVRMQMMGAAAARNREEEAVARGAAHKEAVAAAAAAAVEVAARGSWSPGKWTRAARCSACLFRQ